MWREPHTTTQFLMGPPAPTGTPTHTAPLEMTPGVIRAPQRRLTSTPAHPGPIWPAKTTDDHCHQPPCPSGQHPLKPGACMTAQRGKSRSCQMMHYYVLACFCTVTLKLWILQKNDYACELLRITNKFVVGL